MSNALMLSPADMQRISARMQHNRWPERHAADAAAAGWDLEQLRPLREWYGLAGGGHGGLSMPPPALAQVMWWLDAHRAARAIATVLEVILPPDADPRLRVAIPLMRTPERWGDADARCAAWMAQDAEIDAWSVVCRAEESGENAARMRSAAWAARAAAYSMAAWARIATQEVRAGTAWYAFWGATQARLDLDIGAILLTEWEKE